MQLHTSIDPLSSAQPGGLPAPRFMGLLIFGVLLALVGFSILISITFQNAFVPAPLLVRGGSVYTIPLVSREAPWRSDSAGIHMQVINHK
ncbi:MAG: hypothetical protein M3Y39_16385 [Chloroflexota bacterium]|nr:hypothetical protein [Chloroflexota bacterium]